MRESEGAPCFLLCQRLRANPVRYSLKQKFPNDEWKCPDDERMWVENVTVGSRSRTAATRGPDLSGFGAGDRRIDRVGGRRLHLADGTNGDAAVSGGWRAMAASAVSGRGLAGHRLLAVSLLSRCARQRSAADKGCAVRARRAHHAAHRAGQVFLHVGNARQRNPAGTRRAFGSSWWGHCFGTRTARRTAHRASKKPDSGGSGGGHCSRV